ncbi:hypothetical protein D9M69_593030 [compost metagenome]
MQLKRQSSLGRLRWRAVKQRAENASGRRPCTNTSVCRPAGRCCCSRARSLRGISSGATQREAPSDAIHCSVGPL